MLYLMRYKTKNRDKYNIKDINKIASMLSEDKSQTVV